MCESSGTRSEIKWAQEYDLDWNLLWCMSAPNINFTSLESRDTECKTSTELDLIALTVIDETIELVHQSYHTIDHLLQDVRE
jgi:hypothetical protein